MSDIDFIAKTPRLVKSQDYAFLRSQGLKHVEALARELWTDYNVHDPGITLLELFCYGITELGYRTGYDVADLLTEIENGVEVNHGDFHTAREVLTNHPVSFDDLRKLLIDVTGVRNAWIEKHEGVEYRLDRTHECLTDGPAVPPDAIALGGLYDVFVEYEDDVETEPRVVHAGLPDHSAGGAFILPGGRGIRFDVDYPLTLVAVSVVPQVAGTVRVRLEDSGGQELDEKEVELELAGEPNPVPLGFRIAPGTGYRLRAFGPVRLFRTPAADAGYVHSVERLLDLVAGFPTPGPYFFFYDWQLSYAVAPDAAALEAPSSPPAEPPPTAALTRDDVRLAVVDRLHRHRNFCEDFVNVCDLEKQQVALCADLELTPGAGVEEALAEIFYQLELHVSPRVRFYTIDELRAKGKTVEEIFEGPALDHGFIDDEEFRQVQRKCEIRVSDVVRILMDVEGVVAVKKIALLRFGVPESDETCGELLDQQPWILPLEGGRFSAPELSPECSKVVFYKDDLPYFADRDAASELLAEKRSADLASKLKGHAGDLPVPAGEFKDLEAYQPLQNDLPAVYAVGQVRVPQSRSELRKAQARQLKAFLMFFEQLLANHFSQLAHVRQLFSWSDPGRVTYFTQEVEGIAGLEEVYDPELIAAGALAAELEAIVEDADTAGERKNRFLEHLAGRYAESFTDYDRLMAGLLGDDAPDRLIADKRAFLADYPRVGGERGQAHDYRLPFPGGEDRLSGFARRIYRLLGFRPASSRRLAGHRFRIVPGALDPDAWRFVLEAEEGGHLFASIECERRSAVEVLLDAAFELGSDRDNYRQSGSVWELVLSCPGEPERVLGATTPAAVLDRVVAAFGRVGEAEGFHVVEHVLLRRRTAADAFLLVQLDDGGECACVPVEDPYTFRASVVLPSWSLRFQDVKFRRFVEDTLRREAPAHVHLKICWISHRQMQEFEVCYEEWTRQLALLARGLGRCLEADAAAGLDPAPTGEQLLPPGAAEDYTEALAAMIDKLHRLVTVHPLARLHDCRETTGDAPMITLDNTSLGTF